MKKPLRIILYLLSTLVTILVIVFCRHLFCISPVSLAPLFCIGIMLLMWFIYHSDDVSATGFYVFSSFANDAEDRQLQIMHRFANILLSMIPMQLVFVLLFSGVFVKVIGALGVFFLSFMIDAAINLITAKEPPAVKNNDLDH